MAVWDNYTIVMMLTIYIESRFPHDVLTRIASRYLRLSNSNNPSELEQLRLKYNKWTNAFYDLYAQGAYSTWNYIIPQLSEDELIVIYDRIITVTNFFRLQQQQRVYHFQGDFVETLKFLVLDIALDIQAHVDDSEILAKLPLAKNQNARIEL